MSPPVETDFREISTTINVKQFDHLHNHVPPHGSPPDRYDIRPGYFCILKRQCGPFSSREEHHATFVTRCYYSRSESNHLEIVFANGMLLLPSDALLLFNMDRHGILQHFSRNQFVSPDILICSRQGHLSPGSWNPSLRQNRVIQPILDKLLQMFPTASFTLRTPDNSSSSGSEDEEDGDGIGGAEEANAPTTDLWIEIPPGPLGFGLRLNENDGAVEVESIHDANLSLGKSP